jgi:hypothetical protein
VPWFYLIGMFITTLFLSDITGVDLKGTTTLLLLPVRDAEEDIDMTDEDYPLEVAWIFFEEYGDYWGR